MERDVVAAVIGGMGYGNKFSTTNFDDQCRKGALVKIIGE